MKIFILSLTRFKGGYFKMSELNNRNFTDKCRILSDNENLTRKLIISSLTILGILSVSCGEHSTIKQPVNPYCPTANSILPLPTLKFQSLIKSTTPAVDWTAPHVIGQLILVPPKGISAQKLLNLKSIGISQVTDNLFIANTPKGTSDEAFAKTLADQGLQVQPNFYYQSLSLPNDPGLPGNEGLLIGKDTVHQDYLTEIHIPEAWKTLQSCGKQPEAAVIGVIDSAVEVAHPELSSQVLSQNSFRTTQDGAAVYDHGTAVSGMINAATNNSNGISGIAWNKALVLEETIGTNGASTANVVKALEDAVKRNVKVINLSLGVAANPGDAVLDGALLSASQSAILVAASGNTSKDGIYYPASEPEVVAVGAVTNDTRALTCYSARPIQSNSRQLDIVAPGGNGSGYCPSAKASDDLLVLAPLKSYALEAGTSFAAPQVSAVAALMRAANPDLTTDQTKALLLNSVDRSHGQPLIDAQAAVKAAMRIK